MRNTLMSVVFVSVTFGVCTVEAQKGASDIPLFVWLGSQAAGGITDDGLEVSVGATNADYADGLENVQAVLQSSGNFRMNMQINTRKLSVRKVCVDFGTQLDGLSMVPLPLAYQCVNMVQPMHGYATGDVAIQNLALNQQVQKLTRLAWDENGYRWRIGYGTDMDQNGTIDSPPAVVTCVEFGQACIKWLMTPSGVNGEAALFRFLITKRGEGPAEFVANVDMPFNMTFLRQ